MNTRKLWTWMVLLASFTLVLQFPLKRQRRMTRKIRIKIRIKAKIKILPAA